MFKAQIMEIVVNIVNLIKSNIFQFGYFSKLKVENSRQKKTIEFVGKQILSK